MPVFSSKEMIVEPSKNNALGMLASSGVWLATAMHLVKTSNDKLHPGMDFAPVIHFLLLHGLELILKGFLCSRGISEKSLKRDFGHNIIKLLDKAEKLHLTKLCPTNQEARQRISLIAPNYADKNLQYFMGDCLFKWPLPSELLQDVSHLQRAVEREFRSHLREAP